MCAQYQAFFMQPMLEYVKDPQPEVRQAAVYGCGVLAQVRLLLWITFFFNLKTNLNDIADYFAIQYGGDQFSISCAQAIQLLIEVIMTPGSREPENVNPTENAISAVTKILKYNNKAIPNPDEIIALW